MKKILLFALLVAAAFTLVACGGADTSALDEQISSLQSQLDEANAAADAAQAEASQAMADLDAAKAEMAEGGDAMMDGGGSTLAAVQERGILKCGTGTGASPGFAFIQEDGSWEGFNVDFCKAFAQVVLGDAESN